MPAVVMLVRIMFVSFAFNNVVSDIGQVADSIKSLTAGYSSVFMPF